MHDSTEFIYELKANTGYCLWSPYSCIRGFSTHVSKDDDIGRIVWNKEQKIDVNEIHDKHFKKKKIPVRINE